MSSFSEKIEDTLLSNLNGGFDFYFSIIGWIISRYPIFVEYSLERVREDEKIGIFSSNERFVY